MQKIPTLFVRDEAGLVTPEITPGTEWVVAGEGVPTRKMDGAHVRVTVQGGLRVKLERRRNPSKAERAAGAEPGYVDLVEGDPADKHLLAAVDATDFTGWPDGAWPCEAVGPKIRDGADDLPAGLYAFTRAPEPLPDGPRTFDALRAYLEHARFEGIVWHHPDGRMAKLKRRDFGFRWPFTRY